MGAAKGSAWEPKTLKSSLEAVPLVPSLNDMFLISRRRYLGDKG